MSGKDVGTFKKSIPQLQSLMLTRVLQKRLLPGQAEPIHFPDLAFITEAQTVLVAADSLSDQLDVADIEKPIEIMPESAILEVAVRSGDRFYVHFQPAEEIEGQIRIAMEVRMAPSEFDIQPLGLGGIRATFARTPGGDWEVTEQPAVFSI